jgi:hypothetical protein
MAADVKAAPVEDDVNDRRRLGIRPLPEIRRGSRAHPKSRCESGCERKSGNEF